MRSPRPIAAAVATAALIALSLSAHAPEAGRGAGSEGTERAPAQSRARAKRRPRSVPLAREPINLAKIVSQTALPSDPEPRELARTMEGRYALDPAACLPVRLDVIGGSMQGTTASDQFGGTCYAEAINQLVRALAPELFAGKPGRLSGQYTAFRTALAKDPADGRNRFDISGKDAYLVDIFKSGDMCASAEALRQSGACLLQRPDLADDEFERKVNFELTYITVLRRKCAKIAAQARTLQEFGKRCPIINDEEYGFEAITKGLGDSALPLLAQPTDVLAIEKYYQAHCKMVPLPKGFDCYQNVNHGETSRFEQVQYSLDRGLPAALSYCSQVFNNGRSRYGCIAVPPEPKPTEAPAVQPQSDGVETGDGCGKHASLVIGRRFNEASGHCEFLVRNSWGQECGYLPTGPDGKHPGLTPYTEADCEHGDVWIEADQLMCHTRAVFGADMSPFKDVGKFQ